jgi:hypothetical protein
MMSRNGASDAIAVPTALGAAALWRARPRRTTPLQRRGVVGSVVSQLAVAACALFSVPALAQPPAKSGSDADLAQQLQNPIASLISVPFQSNLDFGAGRHDNGFGYTMNFQPVVPFRLTDDWTLITRTIVPFIFRERYTPNDEAGLGDTTQSFFFSPRSGVPGLTWGIGPAVLWPTATRPAFQSRQWGLGPTGVLVQTIGPWTFGTLANHLWGIAESASRQGRPDLSQTFLQPFVSRNFSRGLALSATLEASYDWTGRQWTLPLAVGASQLLKLGQVPANLVAQARYWLDGPTDAPQWGLRFAAVLVFR